MLPLLTPIVKMAEKQIHFISMIRDEELKEDIRNRADTIYHPVGTCKMGPDSDPNAVVDQRLRVRGIKSLRVIDASIMPKIVSGNTNAPSIMIGEKGAHMILEDAWSIRDKTLLYLQNAVERKRSISKYFVGFS